MMTAFPSGLRDRLDRLSTHLPGVAALGVAVALAGMGERLMRATELQDMGVVRGLLFYAAAVAIAVIGVPWALWREETASETLPSPQSSPPRRRAIALRLLLFATTAAAALVFLAIWRFRWDARVWVCAVLPCAVVWAGLRRLRGQRWEAWALLALAAALSALAWKPLLIARPVYPHALLLAGATLALFALSVLADAGWLRSEPGRMLDALRSRPLAMALFGIFGAIALAGAWLAPVAPTAMWLALAVMPPWLAWSRDARAMPAGEVPVSAATWYGAADLGRRRPVGFALLLAAFAAAAAGLATAFVDRAGWAAGALHIAPPVLWGGGALLLRTCRRRTFLWSGLALAAVSQVGAIVLWARDAHPTFALIPFFAAWPTAIAAIACLDPWRGRRAQTERVAPRWTWLEVGAIALVLLIGAGFRFVRLEELPVGIWLDEATGGLEGLKILDGRPYGPLRFFEPGALSFPTYMLALVYRVFEPTLLATRVFTAATGTLTILLAHLLGRMLIGRWPSVFAAALVALSVWHVNFSRYFMEPIFSLPFECLTFYFLVRGLRTRRWTDFLLCGLFLGFGLMTYHAIRLMPGMFGVLFVHQAIARRGFLKRFWHAPLLIVLGAQLVSCPINVLAVTKFDLFATRTEKTSVTRDAENPEEAGLAVLRNTERHLLMFNHKGDPNPRHGPRWEPKLAPLPGVLFALGLLYALCHWTRLAAMLPVVWLLLGLLAGILTLEWEAPQSCRTMGVIPAVYLLAAFPVALLHGHARRMLGRFRAAATAPVIVLLLAPTAWSNGHAYFVRAWESLETFKWFYGPETVIAKQMASADLDRTYFVHQQGTSGSPILHFLLRNKAIIGAEYRNPETIPLRQPPKDHEVQYLLEPWRTDLPPEFLQHYYPDGCYEEHRDRWGEVFCYTFSIPESDALAVTGIEATYDLPDPNENIVRLETRPLDWDRGPPDDIVYPCNAIWSGSVYALSTASWRFWWADGAPLDLAIDGRRMPTTPIDGDPATSVTLEKGWHDFRLERPLRGPLRDVPRFMVQRPGIDPFVLSRDLISPRATPDFGWHGRYYVNENWEEPADFVRSEPILSIRWHPSPFPNHRSWSARWSATLHLDKPGRYGFSVTCNAYCRILIDGEEVFLKPVDKPPRPTDPRPLAAGDHRIDVFYREPGGYSELRLMWFEPGQTPEVIPFGQLTPLIDAEPPDLP